jgi:hypothetical protein
LCFVTKKYLILLNLHILSDFTRLKIVKGKKEEEIARDAEVKAKLKAEGKLVEEKTNEADITADFDAADDIDVVF